jgi:hypothetical protein
MKKLILLFILSLCIGQTGWSQVIYTQASCGYAPIAGAGTALPACDDCMSGAVPIGFTFSFYGTGYTQCYVSSNGFLTFNAGMPATYPGQALPYAAIPTIIAFSWDDMYTIGATFNYFTTGVAPNRIFVINYNNVGYCCTSANQATLQVQLYETTNQIRIVQANNIHTGRTATMGIQSGASSMFVPGRNAQSWASVPNECISFTPSPPPPPVNDNPCAAIALTAQYSCIYGTYTNVSATPSAGIPAPGCAGYSGGDVWFSVVVPAGGAVNIDTQIGGLLDAGMAVYSGTCASMTLIACDDNNSPNGNMPMINLTGQTVGSTLWIRVWDNGNNDFGTFGICVTNPNAPPPVMGTGAVYITSSFGYPWGSTSNQHGMNAVFGAAWSEAYFATINAAATFVPANCFIFIEGGDGTANEMNTFITANMTLIQNWVAMGGRLILNAAPNQGGNINYGFGGVMLNYDGSTSLGFNGFASPGMAGHPIFNGPFLPCGTSFFGNYFAHSWISGGGTTSLMYDTPGPSVTEKIWGSGRVIFGGWTSVNWHTPFPNIENLVSNIISYQASCITPLPVELISYTGECTPEGTKLLWSTASETNNSHFVIESSTDGITYVKEGQLQGAGNSNVKMDYEYLSPLRNTPGNYFRLKQVDFDGAEHVYSPVYVSCEDINYANCATIKTDHDKIQLEVYSGVQERIICTLLDTRGAVLQTIETNAQKGINIINLNAHGLASGVYFVMINGNNQACNLKFLKE